MCEVLQIAVDNGARTLNIPDTVGYAIPVEWAERMTRIRERVTGDYVLSTHCHNDLGLAVANSLAAVEAGVRQVECTVNGVGERAGNAAMEEIVMALRTRADHFGGIDTGVHAEELARSSRLVSRLTGYPVQYNKAVVGRNAFAHESGIHAHGVLTERTTYEIMDPAAVGAGESKIVLGKHSGRHSFADALAKMGYELHGDALNQAFARFKELADRKVELTEDDLEALVAEEVGDTVRYRYQLISVESHSIPGERSRAHVTVEADGQQRSAAADGDGMVEAACAAIKAIVGIEGRLTDYSVTSVSGGVDALADVALRFEVDGRATHGRGLSTDVVEASARAFLNAINRIVRMRDTGADVDIDRPGSLHGI
jgi:2-isopropylmalate synthase